MSNEFSPADTCGDCRASQPNFFARYRDFLLSRDTIIAFINAVLLLAGFVVALVIALMTISYRIIRAARVNPAQSLKYE